MKEKIIKEKELWKSYYNNYDNLAAQILTDALAYFPEEEREIKFKETLEVLKNINQNISGEDFKKSVKDDLEIFEKINNESAVAYRTLQWVEDELENSEKEIKTEEDE